MPASVSELTAAARQAFDASADTMRHIMARSVRVHQDRCTEQDRFMHFLQFCATAAHAESDATREHALPIGFTANWIAALHELGYVPRVEGNKITLLWGDDEPLSPEL